MRTTRKEKRRGGARDDSIIYINYTTAQLMQLFRRIERKYGIHYEHNPALDTYRPWREDVPYSQWARNERGTLQAVPRLWRKVKRIIRKHLDGWQQELPLF